MDNNLYLKEIDFKTAEPEEVLAVRESKLDNEHCADAIHDAIAEHYGRTKPYVLDVTEALEDVLSEHSPERIAYVLAVRMHDNTWDRRISADNTKWAQELLADVPDIYKNKSGSPFHLGSYLSKDNGLLDLFANEFRKRFGDIRLLENDTEKTAPKKSHKQAEYGE